MSNFTKRTRAWDADNKLATEIIAADPQHHPGIMQEWARLILAGEFKLAPANWGCAA